MDLTLPACNLVVNENFSVAYDLSIFEIEKIVRNSNSSDSFLTYFNQTKQFDHIRLTDEALRIKTTPNAGGSSIGSETMSFEMLKKCFNAKLVKTEMEVAYWPQGGSITDYVCSIFHHVVGVSVTRAFKFNDLFTVDDAVYLLTKKLNGIYHSSKNSLTKWSKQILHVWTLSNLVADAVRAAWSQMNEKRKTNTVLLITVAENSKELFVNKPERKLP